MSYILEALRKSERERRLGQTPSLPSLLVDQPPRRRRWLPWFLLLLVGLNGAALLYFWFNVWDKNQPSGQPVGADQSRRSAETVNIAEEKKRPISPPSEKEITAVNPGSAQSTIAKVDPPPTDAATTLPMSEKLPENTGRPASPPSPKESTRAGTQAPVKKPVRRPAPAESYEEISRNVEMPEDIRRAGDQEALPTRESISPLATASPPAPGEKSDFGADVAAEHDPIPLLSTMPAAFQQRIPAIKVNVLAYSSVPEERFAVIDMVKYSRGDRLPWGAVLREIRSDSLVLELNGSRFRVPHR